MLGPMKLQDKLSRIWEERRLNDEDVAERLGVSDSTVYRWRTARKPPKMDLRVALGLARELGLPLEFLADDDQDEPPPPDLNEDERVILTIVRDLNLDRAEVIRRLARDPAVPPLGDSPKGLRRNG